jgi:ubiquinone biosynthesis protein
MRARDFSIRRVPCRNEMPATKKQLRRRLWFALRAFLPFLIAFLGSKFPVGDRERRDREAARRLRAALEKLGIVFIKVGQVLGVRADLLSPAYVEELGKLHYSVAPVPIHVVKPYLEREYGRVLSEFLERFDAEPLATASMGQVHRARWRGEEIVIKFLKPDTAQVLDTDFQLIAYLVAKIRRFSKSSAWEDVLNVLDRFEAGFREETDFISERAHGERIRGMLGSFPDIYVPEMVPQLCTPRVVAMEFCPGVRITETERVKRLGINPTRMLNRLVQVYSHMILLEGYYHADPHPGNFLIMEDGKIALLDFGMVQTLAEKTRTDLYETIRAATRGEVEKVVDGFYRVGLVAKETPRDKARAAILKIGEVNFTQAVTKNRIEAVGKAVETSQVRFTMPEDLAYAFRLIQMLEGVASHYQPGWNVIANGGPGLQAALESFVAAKPPVNGTRTADAGNDARRAPNDKRNDARNDAPPPDTRRPGESPARRFFRVLQEGLDVVAEEIDKRTERQP